jgi:phi13 family phage major tail protein
MDKEYGEFVGVDNLHYAPITADTAAAYTNSAPVYLAPAAEVAGEPEVANKTTYYDNKAANNYVTEGKTELKIVVANVPAQKAAYLLGKHYDAVSGRVYDEGKPNPPELALGFRYNMGAEDFRYYWYYKGTFSGGAEEAASKSNDVDVKTYTLTFTAVTTTHEWTIDSKSKSLKRVFADTADTAFDPTGWFDQVQTPDTAGSPDALALASSLPADAATGVVVSANLTLTFNNAIEDYAVTLINPTTLAVIPAAYSLDATKKILTINPTDNLAAATGHAIIVTKVTDTYGQTLSNTVIDFTTA